MNVEIKNTSPPINRGKKGAMTGMEKESPWTGDSDE